jgi:hypothetical protein
MNLVYETETFAKIHSSSEKQEQTWIEKIRCHLQENLLVGKPLRYNWFREKKLGNKRHFYLINTNRFKAILVAFGTKIEQQKIINHIIANKERYLSLIR